MGGCAGKEKDPATGPPARLPSGVAPENPLDDPRWFTPDRDVVSGYEVTAFASTSDALQSKSGFCVSAVGSAIRLSTSPSLPPPASPDVTSSDETPASPIATEDDWCIEVVQSAPPVTAAPETPRVVLMQAIPLSRSRLGEEEALFGMVWSIEPLLRHSVPGDVTRAAASILQTVPQAAEDETILAGIARYSDTCHGAGRFTERGRRSRENLAPALAMSRKLVGRPPQLHKHKETFLQVNRVVYANVLETVPPGLLSRSRGETGIPALLSGARGRPATQLPPPEYVDSNMEKIGGYLTQQQREYLTSPEAVNPVEVVARVLLADLSVHPCANGNGRTSVLLAVAIAEWFALPPFYLLPEALLVHELGGKANPLTNLGVVDAICAVLDGMVSAASGDD